jgi:hypothetical protein
MVSFLKCNIHYQANLEDVVLFSIFLSYFLKFGACCVTSTSKPFTVSFRVYAQYTFLKTGKNLNSSYAEGKQVKPFLY